jgi:hypothetical protein
MDDGGWFLPATIHDAEWKSGGFGFSLKLRKMETPIDPPPKSSPDGRKHDDITMRPILAYPPKENAKRHRTRGQHLRCFE